MVNIYEAKAKLSEYLEAAGRGERVLICRHNRPVAELRAIEHTQTEPRDLTPIYAGATFTPRSFFEPLSKDEIDAWEGAGLRTLTRVAEERAEYAPARTSRGRKKSRK